MFAPTQYLAWARRFYGKVQFDLATSGMPTVPLSLLGLPDAARLDEATGAERFREAIAAHNCVRPEEAIATLGASHAIWLAYASLTSPGDEVLVEQPAYEPLIRAAEGMGVRVRPLARDARDGFALDPDRVRHEMSSSTRMVAVTNLHNPSGARASDDALRDIARVAEAQGAYLLVDEVYAPFDALTDESGRFPRSARKVASNIVAISSLTKCYGLGPQRVGWLLGPSNVVREAENAMTASCGHLPLSHAHIGVRALSRIDFLASRARSALIGKRARVEAWVRSLASRGIQWSDPAEGLFALVTVPGAGDLTPAIERMAREHHVLVVPGAFFGVPNAFRLAWSCAPELLDEGLERLGTALFAPLDHSG